MGMIMRDNYMPKGLEKIMIHSRSSACSFSLEIILNLFNFCIQSFKFSQSLSFSDLKRFSFVFVIVLIDAALRAVL